MRTKDFPSFETRVPRQTMQCNIPHRVSNNLFQMRVRERTLYAKAPASNTSIMEYCVGASPALTCRAKNLTASAVPSA